MSMARGAQAASFERADSALVARDFDVDVDLAYLAGPNHLEELRVWRSPRAAGILRWTLRAGPGIADVRVREGRVEAVDAQGYVKLRTEPAFAIDATGQRRELSAHVERIDSGFQLSMTLASSGLTYPVVVDPTWTSGGTMLEKRFYHQAVKLPSGKVMVIGGDDGTKALSTVEQYDPATKSWSSLAPMSIPREQHVGVPLPSGRLRLTASIWASGEAESSLF